MNLLIMNFSPLSFDTFDLLRHFEFSSRTKKINKY